MKLLCINDKKIRLETDTHIFEQSGEGLKEGNEYNTRGKTFKDEDEYIESLSTGKEVFENKVSYTYSFLRRKLDLEDFCDLTGIDYYATRNGFEIKDEEIFYFTESKAREHGLL